MSTSIDETDFGHQKSHTRVLAPMLVQACKRTHALPDFSHPDAAQRPLVFDKRNYFSMSITSITSLFSHFIQGLGIESAL